ncbi:MAG: DUF167 domain-containing protein [Nitrososphaerota archaeon]|nr:DUF167 domain-containing protein [Candidatus Aenigmarchaeota archaeon]
MILKIKVIPNSKIRKIEKSDILKVYVNSQPEKGKANIEVIELLSDYFKIKKSDIKILSGFKSKNKIIEIKNINF